jgi:hypothetical protein
VNAQINYHDAYGDRLEKCYSGAVYDTLRAMGFPDQLLPQTIRPLDPERVEEVKRTGNKVRPAMLKDVDHVDAYLQYREF